MFSGGKIEGGKVARWLCAVAAIGALGFATFSLWSLVKDVRSFNERSAVPDRRVRVAAGSASPSRERESRVADPRAFLRSLPARSLPGAAGIALAGLALWGWAILGSQAMNMREFLELRRLRRECEALRGEVAIQRGEVTERDRRLDELKSMAKRLVSDSVGARGGAESPEVDACLLTRVLENANDVVMITDCPSEGTPRVLYVNRMFERMTGYARDEILGRSPKMLQGPGTDPETLEYLRQRIRAREPALVELLNYRKNGTEFWVELNLHPVSESEAKQTYWVAIQREITEHREAHGRIHYQARHDTLTGLPNRSVLQERIALAVAAAEEEGLLVGVLFCDLDRFKKINDTLGHAAGDRLLQEVASRIHRKLNHRDTLARLGGDEFVVLLPCLRSRDQAINVAQAILESLRMPFQIEGRDLRITASVGVAIAPVDGADLEALLKRADQAMYQAKEEGRDGLRVYSRTNNPAAIDRLTMETHLSKALERGELVLFYQPQVELTTGRVYGSEALLRWESPELGRVSPGMFIPMAEETGLIEQIGYWSVVEACRRIRDWRERGIDLRVSVNLAARNLGQAGLARHLAQVLTDTGVPADRLDIELTEGTLVKMDRVSRTLQALKDLGIRISVDDFGTGYSSLSYLRSLPLDILKVDRSFVINLGEDRKSEAVVRALIELGHGLGLEIIAEGVETEIQRAVLLEMGCDAIQGYLISPPVPAAQFEQMLLDHQWKVLPKAA